ncbi:family 10 glycosylhydrolase [Virgibacillus sp. NKC19-16]|uniref:alpha amylase family protein n=1 Tax=Virgibacillus salidurans TaxID=2831673 RepID=UPI001F44E238|nr:alpha amylase family protein [Virgibacillus sp. NKC19-16]UJL45771.1 family 10 glycosylhydrolase [Virgibacillus sp. NKC19-16]
MKKWISILLISILMMSITTPIQAASDKGQEQELSDLTDSDNMKGRVLWYDLSANIHNLDTPEKVADIVEKTANVNIDTIVLDVKNYTGFVGYDSDIAPHMSTAEIANYSDFPEGYDLLATVLEEADKYGLEVLANVNVFSEGNNTYKDGPAFDNPEWQSQFYTAVNIVEAANGETMEIDDFNTERGNDQLILYTPEEHEVSPSNRWGIEVQVDEGIITNIEDRATTGSDPLTVPENGVVLSAHGDARTWVLENLEVGDEVSYDQTESTFIPASEYPSSSVFTNPIREDVKNYEMRIIEEIVTNYDVDGIVLDRARYANQYADFSDLSREKFEEYIGDTVANWPEDIYEIQMDGTEETIVEGPLYKDWIEFRAHNIQSFFKEAEDFIHSYDEDLMFSTYVGSWYPLYYHEGVNWASQTYQPDYDWATDSYHETGYAEYLDFLMTGNYYYEVSIDESDALDLPYWYSVEGSANLAMEVVNYATPLYGSLYLEQYNGDPEQFRRAVRTAESNTNGIMLFDLVHLEDYDWWYILEEEFSKDTKAPHQMSTFAYLQFLVDEMKDGGEFNEEDAIRHVETHLKTLAHYENTDSMDKAVKHLNGFKSLLEHQNNNELISETAYNKLISVSDTLLEEWQ